MEEEKQNINLEEKTEEKKVSPKNDSGNTAKLEKEISNKKPKKCFLHSAWLPFLFLIFFSLVYYFFAYDLADLRYTDISNIKVTTLFSKYSIFAGIIFGTVSMFGAYLIYFILKKIKLLKFQLVFPILAFLMNLPWYLVARQLVYFENKYTDIAKGIIYYIATPLLSTTKFLFFLILIWILIVIIKIILKKYTPKSISLFIFVFISPLFLNGCVSNINEWACSFFDNPDHCYQNAAVQGGDISTCDKIKGSDFESSGSNPPRDKCFLRIAENTGDLSACDKIEGGAYSYTKEECLLNTSVKFNNPSGCLLLTGSDKNDCITKVSPNVYPSSVLEIDDQIKILKEELEKEPDAGLQKQLDELEKKKDDYLQIMNEQNKKSYESLSDPLNKQVSLDYYSGKIDEKTKDSMIALNDSLREKGEKLSEKEYESISKMLAYKNNPENDI